MDDLDILEKLIAAALEAGKWLNDVASQQRLMRDLEKPEFHLRTRTHDWRNYIPGAVVDVWDDLPTLARLTVFIAAEKQAQAEDWGRDE